MNKKKQSQSLPPISTKSPEFQFPDYSVETLSNGMKVYMYQDDSHPLINLKLNLKKGSLGEPKPGLCYFTGQMLMRGTRMRRAERIAEELDFVGANFNITTNLDNIDFTMIGLSKYFDTTLDIYCDCLFNSTIRTAEIERFRKKHLSTIEQETADTNYLAEIAFGKIFYKNSGYENPRIGTIESITSITRQDCLNYYKNLFKESEPSIIITGNFNKEEVLQKLEVRFSNIIVDKEILRDELEDVNHPRIRFAIIDKKDALQTTMKIGKTSIGRKHEDFPVLHLVNTIFGGYFQSRLNQLLREKQGLTYGVHSYLDSRKLKSGQIISTNINLENTKPAIEEILKEINRLNKEPLEQEEVETARLYLLGSFVRGIETSQQVATMIQNIDTYAYGDEYYNTFFKQIQNAKVDDLINIKSKYFDTNNLVIALSGNATQLCDQLKTLGDITVFDSELKIVEEIKMSN